MALSLPPTNAPTLSKWNGVGCPDAFVISAVYAENDTVVGLDGNVYKCKAFPYSGNCGQVGFEPGSATSWKESWTLLGSCDGTISPSSSPIYATHFGGCPEAFSHDVVYEAGDKVSYSGVAFECKPHPYSSWCSHNDFGPNTEAGKQAWTNLGSYEGSMSPTASPAFDALEDVAGCPEEYDKNEEFLGGERVTLGIGDGRGIVYKCAEYWRK